MVSGLEQMGVHLSVPSPLSSAKGLGEPKTLSGKNGPDSERPSSHDASPGPLPPSAEGVPPGVPSSSEGERGVASGWQARILAMDCVSLLRAHLSPKLGSLLTDRIINSKRQSTLSQQQVAWRAFQDFISQVACSDNPAWAELSADTLSSAHILHFGVWLYTSKGFESQTIANYKAAVAFYVEQVFGVDCSS